ncbi:DHS-like NAD/FAD-binding domain-containing protein, partial [Aaosphaeria arxii CBS 175.79]
VYHNNARLEAFHEFLREACVQASASNPTPFHHWVNALARDRRLVRLYTQNIDGLELRLPYLFTQTPLTTSGPWPNTIQLHGTLHYSQCTKNGHVLPTDLSLFVGNTPPVCRLCEIAEDERVAAGKRGRNPGGLRPRILLYDQEADWENESIGKVHAHDLEAMPDALIVAGTALDGPGARDLVRSMAEVVRKNNGLAIWINKELPKQNVMACFDVVLKGTC